MNLNELVKATEGKQVTGVVSFEGKFDVELVYIDKEEMQRRLERCKKTVYIKHQAKEELDNEKLVAELSRCIAGWHGLTLGVVSTLVPIEISESQKDEDVPCTEENKLILLRKAYGFDVFVQSMSTDLGTLKRDAERKN